MACSGGGPSSAGFCREVADLLTTDARSFEISAADDPATRAGLKQTAKQFEAVAAASPDDIKPSTLLLAEMTRALATAVVETDPRFPFERAAAIKAAQDPFAETLQPAIDRYNAYVARHCVPQPGGD